MGRSSIKFCRQDDYILKSYRGESEVEQVYFQNDPVFRRGCVRLLVDVVAVAAEVAEAFFDFWSFTGAEGDISTSGRENT